jgi:hypothetical protein
VEKWNILWIYGGVKIYGTLWNNGIVHGTMESDVERWNFCGKHKIRCGS